MSGDKCPGGTCPEGVLSPCHHQGSEVIKTT